MKATSDAISMKYVNGRTPFVEALTTVNVNGLSSPTFAPLGGCMVFGIAATQKTLRFMTLTHPFQRSERTVYRTNESSRDSDRGLVPRYETAWEAALSRLQSNMIESVLGNCVKQIKVRAKSRWR